MRMRKQAYRDDVQVRRRVPAARMEVRFPAAGEAAVRHVNSRGTGRPPAADRLDMALGLVAWGIHRTDPGGVRAVVDRVRRLATAIADPVDIPRDAIPVRTPRGPVNMEIVPWDAAAGPAPVVVELSRAPVGPVPVVRGSPPAAAVVLAGLCALLWAAGRGDAPTRLSIALALEGIITWYREADRLTPPRDAVRAARAHAADRLTAAGHALPPCLDDGDGRPAT
jgi:hypothetical protein